MVRLKTVSRVSIDKRNWPSKCTSILGGKKRAPNHLLFLV